MRKLMLVVGINSKILFVCFCFVVFAMHLSGSLP